METQNLSFEQILKAGEQFYLSKLKDKLERESLGQYVAIDVEAEQYTIAPTRLAALDTAKQRFGDKLFYVVRVGELSVPSMNFKTHGNSSWAF